MRRTQGEGAGERTFCYVFLVQLFTIAQQATFDLPGAAGSEELLQAVRAGLANEEADQVRVEAGAVRFAFLGWPAHFWFDTWNVPQSVREGMVRAEVRGREAVIHYQLELFWFSWAFVGGLALAAAALSMLAHRTAVPFILPAFLLPGFLIYRIVVTARFETLLERALEGLARPRVRSPTS
jgi:hypothetical protein